jgi:hypothetical protein
MWLYNSVWPDETRTLETKFSLGRKRENYIMLNVKADGTEDFTPNAVGRYEAVCCITEYCSLISGSSVSYSKCPTLKSVPSYILIEGLCGFLQFFSTWKVFSTWKEISPNTF